MSGVMIHAYWASSPAVLSVSRSARLLFIEALLWSEEHDTAGIVPDFVLRHITSARSPKADAAELVREGLWERVEGNGWIITESPWVVPGDSQ